MHLCDHVYVGDRSILMTTKWSFSFCSIQFEYCDIMDDECNGEETTRHMS